MIGRNPCGFHDLVDFLPALIRKANDNDTSIFRTSFAQQEISLVKFIQNARRRSLFDAQDRRKLGLGKASFFPQNSKINILHHTQFQIDQLLLQQLAIEMIGQTKRCSEAAFAGGGLNLVDVAEP